MKIDKGLTFLQRAYNVGIFDYPRVENNYIKDKPFQLFPHPPLYEFGKDCTPIKKKKLPITMENALLYLSHRRVLTPANIKTFQKTIEENLNEDLSIKEDKEEELKKVFLLLDEFLNENNITVKMLITKFQSLFTQNFQANKILFNLQEQRFYKLNFRVERLRKIRSFFLEDKTNGIEQQVVLKSTKNIEKAIQTFKKEKWLKEKKIKKKK